MIGNPCHCRRGQAERRKAGQRFDDEHEADFVGPDTARDEKGAGAYQLHRCLHDPRLSPGDRMTQEIHDQIEFDRAPSLSGEESSHPNAESARAHRSQQPVLRPECVTL